MNKMRTKKKELKMNKEIRRKFKTKCLKKMRLNRTAKI